QPGKSSDEDCKAQMGMPENPPYRYWRGGVDVVIHDFCSVRFPLRTGIARCGPPDAVQASLTVGVRTATRSASSSHNRVLQGDPLSLDRASPCSQPQRTCCHNPDSCWCFGAALLR